VVELPSCCYNSIGEDGKKSALVESAAFVHLFDLPFSEWEIESALGFVELCRLPG
jgi:hypothetical protein